MRFSVYYCFWLCTRVTPCFLLFFALIWFYLPVLRRGGARMDNPSVALRPNITQTWFRGRYYCFLLMPLLTGMNVCWAVLLLLLSNDSSFSLNNLIICTLIHKSSLPNCFTFLNTRFRSNENEFSEFEQTVKFARIVYGNS